LQKTNGEATKQHLDNRTSSIEKLSKWANQLSSFFLIFLDSSIINLTTEEEKWPAVVDLRASRAIRTRKKTPLEHYTEWTHRPCKKSWFQDLLKTKVTGTEFLYLDKWETRSYKPTPKRKLLLPIFYTILPDVPLFPLRPFLNVQTCNLSTKRKNLPILTLCSSQFKTIKGFTKFLSRFLSLCDGSTTLYALNVYCKVSWSLAWLEWF